MGMYTSMRFEAKLNEKGLALVEFLNNFLLDITRPAAEWVDTWHIVDERFPDLMITEFADDGRSCFIPIGSLIHAPPGWEPIHTKDGDSWKVCTTLKNGTQTCEKFMTIVLAKIIRKHCRVELLAECTDGDDMMSSIVIHPLKPPYLGLGSQAYKMV